MTLSDLLEEAKYILKYILIKKLKKDITNYNFLYITPLKHTYYVLCTIARVVYVEQINDY